MADCAKITTIELHVLGKGRRTGALAAFSARLGVSTAISFYGAAA